MSFVIGAKLDADAPIVITRDEAGQGYGVCSFRDGNPEIVKHVGGGGRDELAANHFLVGCRHGDEGDNSEKNTPPYRFFKWAYVHGGEVAGFVGIKAAIVEKLHPLVRMSPPGDTGAEHVFQLALSTMFGEDMSGAKDMDASILRPTLADAAQALLTLQKVAGGDGSGSATAILSNGEIFAGVRCGAPLYILERAAGEHGTPKACTGCGSLTVDVGAGPRGVLLASVPITEEDGWQEVPDNSVVIVSHDFVVTITPFDRAHDND